MSPGIMPYSLPFNISHQVIITLYQTAQNSFIHIRRFLQYRVQTVRPNYSGPSYQALSTSCFTKHRTHALSSQWTRYPRHRCKLLIANNAQRAAVHRTHKCTNVRHGLINYTGRSWTYRVDWVWKVIGVDSGASVTLTTY